MKRIIRDYHKQRHGDKFCNLDEMNKYLKNTTKTNTNFAENVSGKIKRYIKQKNMQATA